MAAAAGDAPYSFPCSIRTDKDVYAPKEAVSLSFTLTNNNGQDLYVLKWHTPLEGMLNNFLSVTVDGIKVPYRGIMVKRGPPSAESYSLVSKGSNLDASVNITDGYSTETCGKYIVQLKTSLMDVVPQKEGVDFKPNGFNDFSSVAISSNPIEFNVVC
jgi:hypothetical protein